MASLHAGCVLIGDAGVLIRGASGSGKSLLAGRLIDAARAQGVFACLVADDRLTLTKAAGRLIARPNRAIAGKMEARGLGIVAAPHEDAAIIRLVVDCVAETPSRLPEDAERSVTLEGVALPRVVSQAADIMPVWIMLGLTDRSLQSD